MSALRQVHSTFLSLILALAIPGLGYAQVPISGLPQANQPLSGSDVIILNQKAQCSAANGCTRQAPVSSIVGSLVSLSANTGISLSPNPITGIGSIGLSIPVSVTSGGTGVTSISGLILGNGAGPFTGYAGATCTNQFLRSLSASGVGTCNSINLASDVTGNLPVTNLNSGTGASATTYWSGAGTWTAPAGGITGLANPSGLIGLTAVNGVATTADRSDSTHAIDQSIAPTWTGLHIFGRSSTSAPAFGESLAASAASGGVAASFFGPTTGAAGFNVDFQDTTNTVTRGFIGFGTSTILGSAVTDFGIAPGTGGSVVIGTAVGAGVGTRFGPNGNVTISTPSSGSSLTLGGIGSGSSIVNILSPSSGIAPGVYVNGTGQIGLGINSSGTDNGFIQNDSANKWSLAHGTSLSALGTDVLSWNAAGNVTIPAPTSGVNLSLTGLANSFAQLITGASTTSQSFGLLIDAGTNASDNPLVVKNQTASTTIFNAKGDGSVQFPAVSTTGSAANAFLDNANSNNLLRSTSSRRYKKDIESLTSSISEEIYKLKAIRFHSLASADPHDKWFYGLVAEDVAKVEPRLVSYDREGRPDGVQYDRVQVLMLPEVQKMHRQIFYLQTQVFFLWAAFMTSVGFTLYRTRKCR